MISLHAVRGRKKKFFFNYQYNRFTNELTINLEILFILYNRIYMIIIYIL